MELPQIDSSRCKKSIRHIYDHYIIFEQKCRPAGQFVSEAPTIKYLYPPINEQDKDLVERVKHFAFPIDETM